MDIYMLTAVVKILVKIILEQIQEHFESLIDKEQINFRYGSFRSDSTKGLFEL